MGKLNNIMTLEEYCSLLEINLDSPRFKTCVRGVLKQIDRQHNTPSYNRLKTLLKDSSSGERVLDYVRNLVYEYIEKDKVKSEFKSDGIDITKLMPTVAHNDAIKLGCEPNVKEIIKKLQDRDQ